MLAPGTSPAAATGRADLCADTALRELLALNIAAQLAQAVGEGGRRAPPGRARALRVAAERLLRELDRA